MPAVDTYDALLSGISWNGVAVAERPAFVTYSFDAMAPAHLVGRFSQAFLASFQAFTATEQAAARQALAAWGDISGLTFLEVPAGQGDIRFGVYDFAYAPTDSERTLGFAYLPQVLNYSDGAWEEPIGGDVFINLGQANFDVLVHEIGHAIGLKHPFEGSPQLDVTLDDLTHTVMTYNVAGGPATKLGLLDVLAVQHLYGPATADGTQAASWSWDATQLLLTQSGSAGDDTLAGVAVRDRIMAGAGADYVMARDGDDLVDGGDGADTLAGGGGADTLMAGAGDDIVDGDDGGDSIDGGAGADELWGMSGDDALSGGDGDDYIHGGSGVNRLNGGTGDDIIVVVDGASFVDGGDGEDELWLAPASTAAVSLSYASLTAAGGTWASIEKVVLFGDANADTLQGGSLADVLSGAGGADILSGGDGSDELWGGTGADTLSGGAGADSLYGGSDANYLRGDDGNDSVTGGGSFDDINGNAGNDTASGGAGDDWVVGGKDNDSLAGDSGADIVYGNLGADTCDGGAGADILRGGQQDDVLIGGAGDDWLSGDRDSDTLTGGAGADVFHTFGDAGLDQVADFNQAEGDRVQLDPGTQYTVAQVGADTVITMAGGGQMVLVGVQLGTLTSGWIYGA
ncbi:matrixin family metalloprotease [Phenylobacterium sp.]|uniref:matrixin family metalloprotease n=1 Tax=Phenylobacterium sp. TaxID=1871053 RepID=UPI0025D3FEA9|nr:matrixin family metalloprotease [Phenylobacterium sp.]